jgi:hypothetical protein
MREPLQHHHKVDDTKEVGLITAYNEEVRDLAVWFQNNNLSLNVSMTKRLIMDYRGKRGEPTHRPHR